MRIAFVLTEFPVTSELFIVRQITGLLERGHEVAIFAEQSTGEALHERLLEFDLLDRVITRPRAPESLPRRVLGALQLIVLEPPRGMLRMARTFDARRRRRQAFNLRLLYAMHGWARAGDFDLVHAHFAPNGVTAVDLRAVGCFDAPVITTFHGYDINVLPALAGGAGYARLSEEGDAFTAGSEFLAGRAVELGFPRERITILPMGVDLTPPPERVSPKDGVMRVLTVARLSEEKGLADAITAVGRAITAGAPLRYRIIGGGPLEPSLRAQIASAGLADHVTLEGVATEAQVRDAYLASDLFLLASVRGRDGSEEAQGLVLQEAQAMGLPVIASRIGGIPEGVEDGVSGYLVAPGDISAMSDRLVALAGDPALRQRMGRQGRELVEQRFDIDVLNDRVVALYARVIDGRRSRSHASISA